MFTLLHSSTNQELFEKYVCNQSSHYKIWWCRAPQLSSATEVSIALLCLLCSTHYTAVQIKKSTSVIKVDTMKSTDDFSLCKGSHHVQPRLSLSTKMNGTQRRTLVSPRRTHCMHCGMPKGTSLAEATSNSEKINRASSLSRYQVTLHGLKACS